MRLCQLEDDNDVLELYSVLLASSIQHHFYLSHFIERSSTRIVNMRKREITYSFIKLSNCKAKKPHPTLCRTRFFVISLIKLQLSS